jgi:hypothetical protein
LRIFAQLVGTRLAPKAFGVNAAVREAVQQCGSATELRGDA